MSGLRYCPRGPGGVPDLVDTRLGRPNRTGRREVGRLIVTRRKRFVPDATKLLYPVQSPRGAHWGPGGNGSGLLEDLEDLDI